MITATMRAPGVNVTNGMGIATRHSRHKGRQVHLNILTDPCMLWVNDLFLEVLSFILLKI
jgi:hypothetical protein